VAIINAADPRVAAMADRTAAHVITFADSASTSASASVSASVSADIRAADVRLDALGRPSFTLLTPEGSAPVTLRLHGAHQVGNALAAAALAGSLGLGLADIADGLSAAEARSRWRMEVRARPDGVVVINDAYNANPESMRAALDALGHLARTSGGRAFAVLGHMAELGSTSRAAHEEIGSYAASSGVAGLIAVGDEAAPVLDGAHSVGSWRGDAFAVPTGAAALAILRDRLKPSDVVLVKASRAAALEGAAAELLTEADS
jgi:UDP-N-acetylmuramoyl-tripeptide--D-alanyl-D-alanine ligase